MQASRLHSLLALFACVAAIAAKTPEQMEKFKQARAAMIADPSKFNESLGRLSPEAQVHAKAIWDIIHREEDPAVVRSQIDKVREHLPAAILGELDAHRDRLVELYGYPKGE